MNMSCRTSRRPLLTCGLGSLLLFVLSAAWSSCAEGPAPPANSGERKTIGEPSSPDPSADAAELAEHSRDAGLLTDWHLMGRYGHPGARDFARCFAPERWAASEAAKQAAHAAKAAANQDANQDAKPAAVPSDRHFRDLRYELLFPEGTFVLPPAPARGGGVFYAVSRIYLSGGGEWNLYLESGAEAVVFIDGRRALTRDASQTGAVRETIHAASGYHMVMVKFVAQSAPFRVAILPPNSGSRRKNNTPYLQGGEDLNAGSRGLPLPARTRPV